MTPDRLTPQDFRHARAFLGLENTDIANHLGITASAVSYYARRGAPDQAATLIRGMVTDQADRIKAMVKARSITGETLADSIAWGLTHATDAIDGMDTVGYLD